MHPARRRCGRRVAARTPDTAGEGDPVLTRHAPGGTQHAAGAGGDPGAERGSATAEWVLVAALLTLVLMSVLQVGFALHVRTTLIDAAAEGARAAALHGADPIDGIDRTRTLIAAALDPHYADRIDVAVDGEQIIVTVTAPLPMLGLVGIPGGVEVSAHAPREQRP